MNSRHLQFCLNYLQTNDPGVAYKMAYPKANNNSVYAAASRLMARPDVSAWIAETEQRMHDRVMRQVEQEQGDTLKEQLLTINQKRAVLTKIITGETKRVRHIKTKYSYEKVEDDLPIYAVLRAIDMDTRLENFYNLLSNPDSWKRAQTVYVNTPTLQQQVNVLVSQTTATDNSEHICDEVHASPDTQEVISATGTSSLHELQEVSEINTQKNIDEQTRNNFPFKGGEGGCLLEPEEKTTGFSSPPQLNNMPAHKKTPHYLTKLNKTPRKHMLHPHPSPNVALTANSLFLSDININERK